MIPKVIHYCWFGGKPLTRLGRKCLASWQRFFPDYEIKRWDESNFDVHCIPYVEEAYKAKKFAFVSDYARMWILYNHGGIYFDTDVEVIRPMDDVVAAGPFMGCENVATPDTPLYVAPGLGMAFEKGDAMLKEFIDYYNGQHFLNADGSRNLTTVVLRITELLEAKGLRRVDDVQNINGVNIYPKDYFCPIDVHGQVCTITDRTLSIHYYAGSWTTPMRRFKKRLARCLGPAITLTVMAVKRKFKQLFKKKG